MKTHAPARDVWEFEKYLASKPDVWRVSAVNLRGSAEALRRHDADVFRILFREKEKRHTLPPAFFSAGVERMLMGFALENLVKAVLLLDPAKLKSVFARDGNLSWGGASHDLRKLYQQSTVPLTQVDERYLELWQTCSLWAGRYPIPANEHDLPPVRRAVDLKALERRSRKRVEDAMKKGDPFMGVELHDLLHTGVGAAEWDAFTNLFGRTDAVLQVT